VRCKWTGDRSLADHLCRKRRSEALLSMAVCMKLRNRDVEYVTEGAFHSTSSSGVDIKTSSRTRTKHARDKKRLMNRVVESPVKNSINGNTGYGAGDTDGRQESVSKGRGEAETEVS
jgi:hypothetical protein